MAENKRVNTKSIVVVVAIAVVLVLGAVLIPRLISSKDNEIPEAVVTLQANLASLAVDGKTLEDDFNVAIDAGCGDDLDAFNQNVTQLVTRRGTHREGVAAALADLPTPDQLREQVSWDVQQATTNQARFLLHIHYTIDEEVHPRLTELSNSCNGQ